MDSTSNLTLGRTYTKGRRQPYLIRKWPGSNWALPLGPYTVTQLSVFVGSVYLLFTYRDAWAHFGALNLVIGIGIPVALTYATRHSRIEGRDPLRAAIAYATLLLRPRHGYLHAAPVRSPRPRRCRAALVPVAALPAGLPAAASPPGSFPLPGTAPLPPPQGRPSQTDGRWVSELVGEASRKVPRP